MKYLIQILILLLISSCSTIDNTKVAPIYSSTIPDSWDIKGRLSATNGDQNNTSGFELKYNNNNFSINLTAALGLGNVSIQSIDNNLIINNKLITHGIKTWSKENLGWYLDPKDIAKIVFTHDINANKNWSISISKYQQIKGLTYPKILLLQKRDNSTTIKLLISSINR